MALNTLDRAPTSDLVPATPTPGPVVVGPTPPPIGRAVIEQTTAPALPVIERATALPGSATAIETWAHRSQVEVRFAGELDAYDRHAVVDLLTGCVLAGARDVRLDLGAVTFVDLPVLHALDRVRWHVERVGGRLQVDGLGPTTRRLWAALVAAHPGDGVGPTLAA